MAKKAKKPPKPGGTFVGNIFRGIIKTATGIELQPKVPLTQSPTQIEPITLANLIPKDVKETVGDVKSTISNVEDITKWMRYGLIGLAIIVVLKIFKIF